MSGLEIIIRDDTIEVPEVLKKDGRIILDLDVQSVYESIEVNTTLKEGKNEIDAAYSVSLPYTPINNLILNILIDPHVVGQTFESILCQLTINGQIEKYNKLYVDDKDDATQRFNLVIHDKDSNPLNIASETKLSTLVLGVDYLITLDKETIDADRAQFRWNDDDLGFRYGFEWFGKSINFGYLTAADLRPRWSPMFLLKAGFRSFGWDFQSDILETDIWRDTWAYLSDATYGGNFGDRLDRYRFLVEAKDATFGALRLPNISGGIAFTEVYDNNYNWESDSSKPRYNRYYSAFNLEQDIILDYDIDTGDVTNRDQKIKIQISQYQNDTDSIYGLSKRIIAEREIDLSLDDANAFKGTVQGILIPSGSLYIPLPVELNIWGPDEVKANLLQFYNEPRALSYIEGQILYVPETISPDLDLYTLLKGIQHCIAGHIDIDWNSQIVTLKVPFDVTVFTQEVTGHLIKYPKSNIQDALICVSRKMSIPDRKQARNVVYGFKKSTDAYIKSIEDYKKDAMPFDKTFSLGPAYEDKTKYDRNPLFEPTLLREVKSISSGYPVHLSVLQDNESRNGENEISLDIGARLCISTPQLTQNYLDPEGNVLGTAKIKWYDQELAAFPIYYNSLEGENFEFPFYGTARVAVYGSVSSDWWSLYIKQKAVLNNLSQSMQFKMFMHPHERYNLEIYRQVTLQYGYEFITGFLQQVKYNHNDGTGSIILSTPVDTSDVSNNVFNDESNEAIPVCSDNKPELIYTPGSTITMELGGVNAFPVQEVLFQYRLREDGNGAGYSFKFVPWIDLHDGTPSETSVSFTNPLEEFNFLMTVKYAEVNGVKCPDKTIWKIFDPCGNFPIPTIEDVFDLANKLGGRRINLNKSQFTGTITTLTATVKINQQAAESYNIDPVSLYGDFVYTLDDNVTPNFVLQTLEITFANGCTYSLPDPIPNVELLLINVTQDDTVLSGGLELVKSGFGSGTKYLPKLKEIILPEEPEEVRIIFKNDEFPDGLTWNKAMGPIGKNVSFRLAIQRGNNQGIYYSDWETK